MKRAEQIRMGREASFQFYDGPISNLTSITTASLVDVYRYITSEKAREHTLALRELTTKAEQRAYKAKHFDYVLFSGIFSARNDAGLTTHSGLICLDFDGLGSQRPTLRTRLHHDKYFETMMLFTSPSGDGLKWVISIDLSLCTHAEWFKALASYVNMEYGVEPDPQCRNVSRACYLPYDPMCYICPSLLKDDTGEKA